MSFEVADHAIFATLAGSQAHGTSRADSDVDVRGVCIAPLPIRLSISRRFEQFEGLLEGPLRDLMLPRLEQHPSASRAPHTKIECVIFDVAKFIDLCTSANPNVLEILFADPQDWLHETAAWRILYEQRHRFLSRKVQQTYLGYAMAQLKRIRTHRSWLLHPPKQKPTRADFGLPGASTLARDDQDRIEQSIAERLRSYGLEHLDLPKPTRIALEERMTAFWSDVLEVADDEELDDRLRGVATHALHLPREVVSALNAERKYRAAMKHWESYQTWLSHRNPARADLERRHGYDTKHAMHLVRLMRMGLEALRSGELRVRRPDAAELSAIRDGALSFEALLALSERLRAEMEEAAADSRLPDAVDVEFADALVFELVRSAPGIAQ